MDETLLKRLIEGLNECADVSPPVMDRAVERLCEFTRMLIEAKTRFNVTGADSDAQIVSRHILDSAIGYGFLKRRTLAAGAAIDVGSGAGLPGVVWAALEGFDRIVCCEATRKKADFIRSVARALNLDRLTVEDRRAEELGRDAQYREQFDVAAARALAPLNVSLELTSPLVRARGVCLCFKGRLVNEELETAQTAIATLHLSLAARERYGVPSSEHGGELLLFRKNFPTPERYPRRAGIPQKRPV